MGIVKWVSSSYLTGLGSLKAVIDPRSSVNCKAVYIKGPQIPSFGSLHLLSRICFSNIFGLSFPFGVLTGSSQLTFNN